MKTYRDLVILCEQIEAWEPSFNIGKPVPDPEIAQAEKELGFKLCDQYVDYLKELGWLQISSDPYLGLLAGRGRLNEAGDFVTATKLFNDSVEKTEFTTVFQNCSREWYVLINHRSSTVITYDPFAKEFDDTEMGVLEFLEDYTRKLLKAEQEYRDGEE